MRKTVFSFLLLASAAAALPANAELLPAKFGNWMKGSCVAKPLAPAVAPEAGLSDIESCSYTSGDNKIGIWIHKLHDPSAAYQVYTAGLHPGMLPSLVGTNAAVDKDELWMLSGNLVLRVNSQSLASEEDLRVLVKSLEGHSDKTPLPDIRAFLPSNGLIQGTQRYALGADGYQTAVKSLERGAYADLATELSLGAKSLADGEAMLGAYNNGKGGQEVLLLVLYPTPQLAEQQLHHLQPFLESKSEFKGTTVERDASLLSLVLSPSSPEMAARLRKSIKYDTAITWNEPSQTLTDPPWFTVLKTIFFAAAGFCVFAALAGLIFGVFRLVVKRLFPHKVFDRTESVELLQLGLNSKEIDPDDFY
ncbi:MAG TPA: DUF6599 family protein [Candidatus Acidoferrum sp.]|nr:DUF6599 family protein [Candidatus Acidoferrum sp.]